MDGRLRVLTLRLWCGGDPPPRPLLAILGFLLIRCRYACPDGGCCLCQLVICPSPLIVAFPLRLLPICGCLPLVRLVKSYA